MRHLQSGLLAAGVLVLAGCAAHTGDPAAFPDTAVAAPQPTGAWELIRVDGHALPYAPTDRDRPADAPAAPKIEILGARLILEADGTFRQHMSYRIERDGEQRGGLERDFTGTWQPDGAAYLLTWDGAGRTPARLEGELFTYDNVGMLLTFRRAR
jgi:hypothetical protein